MFELIQHILDEHIQQRISDIGTNIGAIDFRGKKIVIINFFLLLLIDTFSY
jgi:hypothetical protein